MANRDIYSARENYRVSLMRAWIKLHRPDVWQVMDNEIYKKFPRPGRMREKLVALPTTLEKLK